MVAFLEDFRRAVKETLAPQPLPFGGDRIANSKGLRRDVAALEAFLLEEGWVPSDHIMADFERPAAIARNGSVRREFVQIGRKYGNGIIHIFAEGQEESTVTTASEYLKSRGRAPNMWADAFRESFGLAQG